VGAIFICYRRDDTAGHAGRLYDRLTQRFPRSRLHGRRRHRRRDRWADVIDHTLRVCDVAVILIGRRRLDAGAGVAVMMSGSESGPTTPAARRRST
jgi:hypothetical protein